MTKTWQDELRLLITKGEPTESDIRRVAAMIWNKNKDKWRDLSSQQIDAEIYRGIFERGE